MDSFKPYLAKVATGASLTREEARAAFDDLLSGEVTPAQGGAFLMALRVRGETLEEIVGAVSAMRGRMLPVNAPEKAWTVHGSDGLDEMTTTGPTFVAALENGAIRRFTVTPDEVGLPVAKLEDLKGGDPEHN